MAGRPSGSAYRGRRTAVSGSCWRCQYEWPWSPLSATFCPRCGTSCGHQNLNRDPFHEQLLRVANQILQGEHMDIERPQDLVGEPTKAQYLSLWNAFLNLCGLAQAMHTVSEKNFNSCIPESACGWCGKAGHHRKDCDEKTVQKLEVFDAFKSEMASRKEYVCLLCFFEFLLTLQILYLMTNYNEAYRCMQILADTVERMNLGMRMFQGMLLDIFAFCLDL